MLHDEGNGGKISGHTEGIEMMAVRHAAMPCA